MKGQGRRVRYFYVVGSSVDVGEGALSGGVAPRAQGPHGGKHTKNTMTSSTKLLRRLGLLRPKFRGEGSESWILFKAFGCLGVKGVNVPLLLLLLYHG